MQNKIAACALAAALVAAWVMLTVAPAQAQRSVDDAIKVIQQFQAPLSKDQDKDQSAAPAAFVAPPRTIADITAILDQQKPDPAKKAAATAAADREPPPGASAQELGEFYYQRGLAASDLGRAQQHYDDSKKAVAYGQQANIPPQRLMVFLQQVGFAQRGLGNIKGELETLDQRLQLSGRIAQGAQGQQLNIYQNMIVAVTRQGDLDLARELLGKAERVMSDLPPRFAPGLKENMRSQLMKARGVIAFEAGRFAEAEAEARRGLALSSSLVPQASSLGIPEGILAGLRDGINDDLAVALLRQNRLIEAEAETRRVLLLRLERYGRYAAQSAGSMLMLARNLFEQGRYPEAERLANAARDVLETLGHGKDSRQLANARRWIAQAQSAQGKFREAQGVYAALERDIGENAEIRQQYLDSNPNYAATLLSTGRADEAVRILENVVTRSQKNLGERAYGTAQARGALARGLAKLQQTDRAAAEFEAAMPILLSVSREATDSDDDGSSVGQRDRQLQQIVEAYLGLLADTKGSSAATEAFRLADAIRGQSVQRALAASAARSAATDPALANLVRYEQDAQKQATAMQGLMTNILSQPSNQQDSATLKKLREDIDKLRTARATVREEIERKFPDYVNLIDPRPATVEQAQKSLRPGEALIATYAGDERLFVWAIPHQGQPAYASSKVRDSEIEKMVADLRKALDPNAESLEDVPAFDVATAYKLYEMLLKPVEAGWASAKSLMIVPHKALGQLPTALLVTEPIPQPTKAGTPFAEYKSVPFLARKVAVTQLPSVNSLATLRALPAAKGPRETFVAFGDPWFSLEQAAEAKAPQRIAQAGLQTRGAKRGTPLIRRNVPKIEGVDSAELALLPRLPDTAEEVKSIALALRADIGKDVFLGDAANEKTVKTMDLSKRKIVMFATHGLVPGDLNGLTQPALALSAPSVAGIDGDGLLTMEEILALKLNADWVVLSACNTASGAGAGAEAVSGLGRAFFYAGTRALLVSNWPVETVSARTLTTDLFRRQAEDPALARGEAMRQAEVALIDGPGYVSPDTKQPVFSYAHPIFWAPFSVVGDGGISIP